MRQTSPRRLRLHLLAMGLLALVLVASGCGSESSSGSDSDATIGFIAPLTGPQAALGKAATEGMEYWVEETNADGGVGGRQIALDQCDSKGTPDGASQCARRLSGQADLYVSPGVTAEVLAVQAQLPRELVLSISPNLTPEGDTTFFQVGDPVASTIDVMFEQAKAAGIDHIGILAATDASGEATIKPAEDASKTHNVELSVARIEPQDVAASGQLTGLQSDGVGLIYVSYSGAGAATVVQAYSRLGLTVPFVLNSASVTNELLSVISSSRPDNVLHLNQVGALVPEMLDQAQREPVDAFLKSYEEATGSPSDGVSIQMQYVGDVAAAALEAGVSEDPEAAAKELASGTIESLTDITFDTPDGKHYSEGLQPSLISSTPAGKWTPPVLAAR
jgi:branched-chain amino acid transport system substrate-binding protein